MMAAENQDRLLLTLNVSEATAITRLREQLLDLGEDQEARLVLSGAALPPREALALVEAVLARRSRISIHGEGRIEGALLILLACGAPGRRTLDPKARLRLRAPAELVPTGFASLEEVAKLRATLLEHLAEASGLPIGRAFDDSLAEKRLTPRQALASGIADHLDPEVEASRARAVFDLFSRTIFSVWLASTLALGIWTLQDELRGHFLVEKFPDLAASLRLVGRALGQGARNYLTNAIESFVPHFVVGLAGFVGVYVGFRTFPRKSFVLPWFYFFLALALVHWIAKTSSVANVLADTFDAGLGAFLAAIPAHRKLLELRDRGHAR